MLGCFAPHSHHLGLAIEPLLHRFENDLVLPAPDPAVIGGGTAFLHPAMVAVI
jgi:hypothetical protein